MKPEARPVFLLTSHSHINVSREPRAVARWLHDLVRLLSYSYYERSIQAYSCTRFQSYVRDKTNTH
jgi:hypothetical protein